MVGVIQVSLLQGMTHPGGVAPHDVEIGAGVNARLGVPLDLRRPGVVHRRGEDRHNRGLWVKNPVLKHLRNAQKVLGSGVR